MTLPTTTGAFEPHARAGDAPPEYYPVLLDLRHRRVVVVGGGDIAARKVEGLRPCRPAHLMVVAPEVSAPIRQAADAGVLELRRRPYQARDVDQAWLVFGATDDTELNARVAADARRAGAMVLAVDDVPNCDLIAPAVVRRGALTLTISTHGRSPAMARFAREWLSANVPDGWAQLLEVAATVRQRLRAERCVVPAERWQSALQAPELDRLIAAGNVGHATDWMCQRLLVDTG